MSETENFKNKLKVNSKDIINTDVIIRKLEEDSEKYKGTEESKSTTDIFRTGEMMAFDAILSAGLLFKLYETCGRTIDAHILTRVKSQASIAEKQQRKGRTDGKNLGDIIGSSLIADRVHNYTEIISIFNSPEVQLSYNERQANIILLNEVSQFVLSIEPEETNIASDLDDYYSKNNQKLVSRLEANKEDCNLFIDNCNTYFNESKTPKGQRIPINRTYKAMCKYLIEEEIQRGFDTAEDNFRREQQNKEDIEKELEELRQYEGEETSKISMLEKLLSVQNQKLEILARQMELLQQNIENKDIAQLKILLSHSLNTDRIELLEQINEHISQQIDEGEERHKSVEQKYCEYLTIVLYQIKKLEFVNNADKFKGDTYETIEHSLYTQLEKYRDTEIEGNTYRNITFNDLQKLTTNLRRLNSRLSDKLQHNILEYSLQLYLNDVIKQITGEYPSQPDFKIKKNGYVATHIDIDMIKKIVEGQHIRLRKEMKLVTHHRDLESTTGSAAYGSERQENMEAKTRKVELLEDSKEYKIQLAKGPKISQKANFYGNTIQQLQRARETNYLINLVSNTNTQISKTSFANAIRESMEWKNGGKEKWQKQLFSVIPKYSKIEYNSDKDAVNIEFFSDYENVKKYYTETNVPIKRKKTLEQLDELRENGLISDDATKITITHSQYRYFVRNNLGSLRNAIVSSYMDLTQKDKSEKEQGRRQDADK